MVTGSGNDGGGGGRGEGREKGRVDICKVMKSERPCISFPFSLWMCNWSW